MSLFALPQYIWDPSPSRVVVGMIAKAIHPFNPGLVTMWVEKDLDFLKVNIHVTCTTFEDDEAVISGEDLYLMAPEVMAEWVGSKAGAYFASLMNESVPDTIVLGEN